jgi:hypothetical protein
MRNNNINFEEMMKIWACSASNGFAWYCKCRFVLSRDVFFFFLKLIKEEVSMRNNNINFEGNMTRRFYEKMVTAAIMSPFEKIINLVYEVFFVQGSSSSSPGFHIFQSL